MDALPSPSIIPNDYGPKVIIVGAIMLSASLMILLVAFYNRFHAKTLSQMDSPFYLLGALLDVISFALLMTAVHNGLGRHTTVAQAQYLRRVYLGSILVFYLAQGIVTISYNLLARHTARDDRFKRTVHLFSLFIALWTLTNIITISVSLARISSPRKVFFIVSGIISILIILGQLCTFLWIILRTSAKLKVKIRWSLTMGAFVPPSITAIVVRLAHMPVDLFETDWTFHNVLNAMLFLIELNMFTLVVLAPNLPVFFQKTSTGGLHFVPAQSRMTGGTSGSGKTGGSYALSARRGKDEGALDSGKEDYIATVACNSLKEATKRASFDSNVNLIRRSAELGTSGHE